MSANNTGSFTATGPGSYLPDQEIRKEQEVTDLKERHAEK
jgi:hypothetical protein